jgi:CRISPR-associated protein Cmr6
MTKANIPNSHKLVPMMFRAQVLGRCNVQKIPSKEEREAGATLDIIPWTNEWIQEIYPQLPPTDEKIKERDFTFNWRLLSNSGVDDAIIRPVIGARGWPYYPGSSMKGAFKRACSPEQKERYCGKELEKGDCIPGILRFHGAYPTDAKWRNNLIDITHPQQNKQVGTDKERSKAFSQISLYKPTLRFGISSNKILSLEEWEEIWLIWGKALSYGLGSRVSAGYGYALNAEKRPILYRARLQGQGQTAKLLDGTSEFRPNIFRAALYGHALRIFGGLTTAKIAQQAVNELFGSIQDHGNVGLLGLSFQEIKLTPGIFSPDTQWEQSTYDVTGEVQWHLQSEISPESTKALRSLIGRLMNFAMVFGGFGKSWRRADHRLFNSSYYNRNSKPLIGCHWDWANDASLKNNRFYHISELKEIKDLIDKMREVARKWLLLRGFACNVDDFAQWRESWHPETVKVWGRNAYDDGDCISMKWLHSAYDGFSSIKKSSLTGSMGVNGRLWQRMYPVIRMDGNKQAPETIRFHRDNKFLELIVIFPDDQPTTKGFLNYLDKQQDQFQLLWPNNK